MIELLRNVISFVWWPIRHPLNAFKYYILRRRPVITPGEYAIQHLFTGFRFEDGAVESGSETIAEAMIRVAAAIRYDVTMPTKGPEA